LAIYEHAVTISDEVDFIWRYKLTAITILQVANRYTVVLSGIANILALAHTHRNFGGDILPYCCMYVVESMSFRGCFTDLSAAFSAARVYAIGDRQLLLAVITFLLGTMPLATNLVGSFLS
ncbi:hypothetical protein WOLCODRAFT_86254, partial [Wolfiporia cocos MD-104 SS10]